MREIEKKFGYLPEELMGKPVEILVPERFRSAHLGLRQEFARIPEVWPMGAGRDLYGRRKDGTEFPVEIGLNPINSKAGNLVMITVVDISARNAAAERLAATTTERDELRRRLIQAHEQERLHLAHELHDQTGQSLTAVMLEMRGIENSVNEPDRRRLRLLRLRLEQVGQTLHHVAWELRPASIDELGLASALADYISEWGERHDIEADFQCNDTKIDELSDEICTTVYRVVQEALTKIVKHARQATIISVVIDQADGNLRLVIDDDGCGFDTTSSTGPRGKRNGGLGLPGMRERLTLIGGELDVEIFGRRRYCDFCAHSPRTQKDGGVTAKIRIVLADDHPIFLNGVRSLVQAEQDLELVGDASSGLAALKVIREKRPDVAVIDVSMPEMNGILLGRRLADEMSSVRVVVLTLHEDRAYLKQALDAGISGYVLKRSAAETLVQAIRAVVMGGLYVDPAIASRMFKAGTNRAGRQRNDVTVPELSDRETEVLRLVALGFTNREISHRLDLGIKSIETFKARGTEKLGLRSRAELVRYASTEGWLDDI